MRRFLSRASCALVFVSTLPSVPRQNAPTVGLNHIAIVTDSATFAAIAGSRFLRDTFALFEPDSNDAQRVALLGRSTYVEFRRAESGDRGALTSTLTLGTDVRGALRTVADRLTSDLGTVRLDSLSRWRDSAAVPWLYQLALSDARMDSTIAVRVVEYHPAYLQRWYGAPKDLVSVARRDVIALHATAGSVERRFPFVDVVAVKVAADAMASEQMVRQCRGLGWRVQPATGGIACVGPDVRLFVVPARGNERGIVAFTMRVAPSAKMRGPASRAFGSTVLRISRTGFATWDLLGANTLVDKDL